MTEQLREDWFGNGAICQVTMTNPPNGFMDEITEHELGEWLEAFESIDAARVAVLTGGLPGVFIRHYSVEVLERRAHEMRDRGLTFGTAMGGGLELALGCDIRIATDGNYDIGLPEINIGLLPGAGGTQRLTRLIGASRAMELVLRGRTVSPREAEQLGIVSACVDGSALEFALDMAHEIASKPELAVAHIKHLVGHAGTWEAEESGFAEERTRFCDLMVSDDAVRRMSEMNAGRRDIRDRRA